MAKSVYFENCIREIRHSVYGRDNRKPIADAIEQLQGSGISFFKLDSMEAELNPNIVDWIEYIVHTIYSSYSADSGSDEGLSTSAMIQDQYLLSDSRSGDYVEPGSSGNYTLVFGNNEWTKTALDYGKTKETEKIIHHETYKLILHFSGE